MMNGEIMGGGIIFFIICVILIGGVFAILQSQSKPIEKVEESMIPNRMYLSTIEYHRAGMEEKHYLVQWMDFEAGEMKDAYCENEEIRDKVLEWLDTK